MAATARERGGAQVWREARGCLRSLQESADYLRTATLYIERYPRHPPDAFFTSPNKARLKMRAAFGQGDGWVVRLLGSLDRPHFYTLRAGHLGLDGALAAASGYYQHEVVLAWREAVKAHLEPPLWLRLELGNVAVHVHVIAARDAGLRELSREGKVVQPIYGPEGLLNYLVKPPAAYTARNLALWLEAKSKGRLPRTSGTVGIPNKRNWSR